MHKIDVGVSLLTKFRLTPTNDVNNLLKNISLHVTNTPTLARNAWKCTGIPLKCPSDISWKQFPAQMEDFALPAVKFAVEAEICGNVTWKRVDVHKPSIAI